MYKKILITSAALTGFFVSSLVSAQTSQYSEFQQGPVQLKRFENNTQLLPQQQQQTQQSQNQQGSSVPQSEKISSGSKKENKTNVSDETWDSLANWGQMPESKTMKNYYGVDDYSPAYNPKTR